MSNAESYQLSEFPPATYAAWRAMVEKELKGAPFEKKLVTTTYEGIALQPLYTAEDWDPSQSGLSGTGSFVRGSRPLGTFLHGWDVRQERGEPALGRLNEAILDDLEHGVTSVHLRFDRASRNGLDGDDGNAGQLVGVDGAAVYSLEDLDQAFAGVRLDAIGVSLEAGAAFLPAASLMVALWDRREVARDRAVGAFNADPLAVLARDGVLPYSLERGYEQLASLARFSAEQLPHVRSVRVGSAPYHHAGATAVQDLAYSMATGVEYLRVLTDAGLRLDQALSQLLFSYGIGTNLFLAIGKLRAARRLWARIVEVAGGAEELRGMRQHVKTSKRVLTQRDPWVNLLRNTVTCFAAGVAGAEIVTVEPFDSALGIPSKLGRRIARNTSIILQEESHVHQVVDPAGGCWFVEHLTEDLAQKAWAHFRDIERGGGMSAALRSGRVAEEIDSAFKPRAKNLATRRDAITGVSEFPNLSETPAEAEKVDLPSLRKEVAHRVAKQRTATVVAPALAVNAPEALVALARGGATIGQLAAGLAGADPKVSIAAPVAPHPYAAPFEELRDASDRYLASCGARPRVFLANLGPIAAHTGRASYSKAFFEAGGFETVSNDGFETAEAAAQAFRESGANLAVICSTDALYETFVPSVAPALHAAGARTVILAGNPGDKEATYRAAGVDRFIFVRCDVLATLRELLEEEGVLP